MIFYIIHLLKEQIHWLCTIMDPLLILLMFFSVSYLGF